MGRFLSVCLAGLFSFSVVGNGQGGEPDQFVVMFYNVENLFDVIDDSLKQDEAFLPEGEKRWTSYRYYQKLKKLSRVILTANGWALPDVIGLCEVENEGVLKDLLWQSNLWKEGYRIVHFESGDRRGIDVALLYNKDCFRVLSSMVFRVGWDGQVALTRDILYVKGVVCEMDTFHVLVNHWPSRRGGKVQSGFKRLAAAKVLKRQVDSLLAVDGESKVVVMGDFNDSPVDRSVAEVLKAVAAPGHGTLVNLSLPLTNRGKGTYKYRYSWECLDQMMISDGCLQSGGGFCCGLGDLRIVECPFLLEEDKTYTGKKVFRTFRGPLYLGGYSDHLPIVLAFKWRGL